MNYFIMFFNVSLAWLSMIILIISLITFICCLITKRITKKSIFRFFCVGFLCILSLYIVFYAGRYQSMNYNIDTINVLLELDISKIDITSFEMKDFPKTVYYHKSLPKSSNVTFDADIIIEKQKQGKYEYDYKLNDTAVFKLFGKKFSDKDTTVIINPRTSDRYYDDMYLFSPYTYTNDIEIISDDWALTIRYYTRDNNPNILNEILDELLF